MTELDLDAINNAVDSITIELTASVSCIVNDLDVAAHLVALSRRRRDEARRARLAAHRAVDDLFSSPVLTGHVAEGPSRIPCAHRRSYRHRDITAQPVCAHAPPFAPGIQPASSAGDDLGSLKIAHGSTLCRSTPEAITA